MILWISMYKCLDENGNVSKKILIDEGSLPANQIMRLDEDIDKNNVRKQPNLLTKNYHWMNQWIIHQHPGNENIQAAVMITFIILIYPKLKLQIWLVNLCIKRKNISTCLIFIEGSCVPKIHEWWWVNWKTGRQEEEKREKIEKVVKYNNRASGIGSHQNKSSERWKIL